MRQKLSGRIGSSSRAAESLGSRKIRFDPLWALLSTRRIELILGLGVLCRLAEYFSGRDLWMDELSLADNIRGRPWTALSGPLSGTQLAPAAFLAVEWIAVKILGGSEYVLRFFPLICGVASLFLFLAVARRCLEPRVVWVGLCLFAVSDDLIYFSSELKPYSTDVAAALVGLLMGLSLTDRPFAIRRMLGITIAGAVLVWFSFPAAFVLAGVGSVVFASAIARRDWKKSLWVALACLSWVISFVGVYLVSQHQLGHKRDMWAFWNFAFAPMPPSSLRDWTWPLRRWLYLFVNPLDFETPLGFRLSALPAIVFYLIGCGSMGARDRRVLAMLLAPGSFVLTACYLHLYPFHGRLVLFLVPLMLLLIAEGAGWVMAKVRGTWIKAALLATILLFPTARAVLHLVESRTERTYNPVGDRRPIALDPERFPF